MKCKMTGKMTGKTSAGMMGKGKSSKGGRKSGKGKKHK